MSKLNSITLIGAGGFGSRHLQSLAHSAEAWDISVVDPSGNSLDVAQARWREETNTGTNSRVRFVTKLSPEVPAADIVIVATDARSRLAALEQCLSHGQPEFLILEKVLFQSVSDLDRACELLSRNKPKTYVNCPRRVFPFYQDLKRRVEAEKDLVTMSVVGDNWDMGSNAIHHIDLWAFLSSSAEFKMDACSLEQGRFAGKRPGTEEIHGELSAVGPRGRLKLVSNRQKGSRDYSTSIQTGNLEIVAHEPSRSAVVRDGEVEKYRSVEFVMTRQSRLTHVLAEGLIRDGKCDLTPFAESAQLHRGFLMALTRHFEGLEPGVGRCPIT
jgi:predicted dehydrogenase